jgi:hypothetical protein
MWGYFWVDGMFVVMNVIGIFTHIFLYILDKTRHDGILDRVDKDEKIDELMSSPKIPVGQIIRQSMGKTQERMGLVEYKANPDVRQSLRRSMAKTRQ